MPKLTLRRERVMSLRVRSALRTAVNAAPQNVDPSTGTSCNA